MGERQIVAASASEKSLYKFDQLPNSAYVRLDVVMGLFACARATVYRWQASSIIPKPIKRGGITAWNVGELREALSTQTIRPSK